MFLTIFVQYFSYLLRIINIKPSSIFYCDDQTKLRISQKPIKT